MGLLQKLSNDGLVEPKQEPPVLDKQIIQKKSNSVGLLKKSLMASQNGKLDFFEFIQKYNLSLCSLLKPQDGFYCIYKSCGFDGKSICQSYSTKDFWDGTIKDKNNLYTFKTNTTDILPFYQFFSDKLKNKIQLLYLFKFDDDSIFIFITDSDYTISQDFVYDLQNIDFEKDPVQTDGSENNSTVFEYEIDLSEALESFVLTNSKTNKTIIDAISDQIYFNLIKYFPKPSKIQKTGKGKYKLLYCIPQALPVELLTAHLQNEIKFILDNHSELISVELLNNVS